MFLDGSGNVWNKVSNLDSENDSMRLQYAILQYKLITKVIANRVKDILPTIIPANQGGFIKGRHIADNIILVQEAIHSSNHRGEKGMIVKLDLATHSTGFDMTFYFR